jgi:alkylated DNA nucleotide flippase Atl1
MKPIYMKIWSAYAGGFLKTGKYPTYEQIGRQVGLSKQRVGQIMVKMREKGYLIKPHRSQKFFLWDIEKFT